MPEPGPTHHHARPAHALVSLVQTWPLLMSTAVRDRGAVTDLWLHGQAVNTADSALQLRFDCSAPRRWSSNGAFSWPALVDLHLDVNMMTGKLCIATCP